MNLFCLQPRLPHLLTSLFHPAYTRSDDSPSALLFASRTTSMKTPQAVASTERALLVGVAWKRSPRIPGRPTGTPERESLAELVELARSAGAEIAGTVFQVRDAADPATLVGRGKLDEIRAEANAKDAPLIVFDSDLSPVQQRNIEEHTECRVIDRTQLILDIFARHARSREGQLQVELAQLNYRLPRLTGKGAAMSRLGGKSGGGGAGRIGVRGPGEKKLETDRRRIRDRVRKIQTSIDDVRKQRALRRQARNSVPLGTVALVGYTNAGKSTLFNALSKAEVLVSSRMFATLDPTIRALRLPSGRRVLLSDTVGFIRDLPKGLMTAFRATLEEVQEAAVVLHVSDISSPHHQELYQAVKGILADLGVAGRPTVQVWNKIDLLPEDLREELTPSVESENCAGAPVLVSAAQGAGLEELLYRIDASLPVDPVVKLSLRLPLTEGRTLALVHALGKVLHSELEDDAHMLLEAEVPESIAQRLKLHDFVLDGTSVAQFSSD